MNCLLMMLAYLKFGVVLSSIPLRFRVAVLLAGWRELQEAIDSSDSDENSDHEKTGEPAEFE